MQNSIKKINNLEILIFGIFFLIPLFVIFSRFLLNAIVIFFFLFVIVRSFINKNWSFLCTEITAYLFAFLFYLFFVSIVFHDLSSKSVLKLIWLFLVVFFLLGLANYAFVLKKNLIKILVLFFFFLTVFVIIDCFYQFFNPKFKDIFGFSVSTIRQYSILGSEISLPIRLSGPMGDDELVVGFYLSIFGFLSIFFLKHFFKLSNKIYYFLLFINFFTIILSGERSSMLIFLIIFFTQEFLFKSSFKKKLFNFFLIFFLFFASVYMLPNTRERLKDLDIWLLSDNNQNNIYENFLRTPWGNHYEVSLELIKRNLYFGVGLRNFTKTCLNFEKNNKQLNSLKSMRAEFKIMQNSKVISKEIKEVVKNKITTKEKEVGYFGVDSKCSTHPHNYVLELLVETGVFGLLLFFFIIFKIYYIFFKKLRQNSLAIICISLLTGFLFPIKPTGSIFASWFGLIFWLQILFFLVAINLEKRKLNLLK